VPDEHSAGGKGKVADISRRDAIKKQANLADAEEPEMPPIEDAAHYLISYLFEIGPTLAAGMGNGPLTHAEIMAWQINTGIELQSWEARILKRLSNHYLAESQRATARDCPAPWADAPYVRPAPSRVAMEMQQSLMELAKL
jgi:hypothetical protein